MNTSPISVVELFAGVGGFRVGLERASPRFQTIWVNQWEPYAKEQYAFECYCKHFGVSPNYTCQDIALAKTKIPFHDLLVGGFPCQDYSVAKKGAKGIEGSKGALWWEIDSIISACKPPFVLLENVDRLIRSPSKQQGRDFGMILRCLYENGYAAEWRVINAADYGMAQRRRRTFFFAFKNTTQVFQNLAESACTRGLKGMHHWCMEDGIFARSFPLSGHRSDWSEAWVDEWEHENISSISQHLSVPFYRSGVMINGHIYSVETLPQTEKPVPLGSVLESDPIDTRYFLNPSDMEKWHYLKGCKNELRRHRDGSSYRFTEGAVGFPDALYKPSRTMLTSEGQITRSSHVVADAATGKLRILTPRECERLNGLPDDWTATMPERQRYFTMGNALVTQVVERIGTVLGKLL